jgi:hypothetical protein
VRVSLQALGCGLYVGESGGNQVRARR